MKIFITVIVLLVASLVKPICKLEAANIIDAAKYGIVAGDIFSQRIASENSLHLNQLLKKCQGNNDTIQLPFGRIWISAIIKMPSGTNLTGDPAGSVLSIAPQFKDAGEGFLTNENYNLGNMLADSFLTLTRFTIDGGAVKPVSGQPRGVFFNKVKHVRINGIRVLNTVLEGIRIDNSQPSLVTSDIIIENCFVERRGQVLQNIILRSFCDNPYNSNKTPSAIGQVIIRNNTSIGGYHGILTFNSHDVLIEENICISNLHRGINASPTNSNIIIRKNRIDSAGSTGIIMAFSPTNFVVDSNVVTNTLADMSGIGIEGQGIKVYIGFSNVAISNNICINNATDGIAIEGGRSGEGFVIEGNTCINNKRNGIRLWGGILNQGVSGNIVGGSVQNNLLSANSGPAIFVGSDNNGKGSVKKVRITNNYIKETETKRRYKIEFNDGSVKIE